MTSSECIKEQLKHQIDAFPEGAYEEYVAIHKFIQKLTPPKDNPILTKGELPFPLYEHSTPTHIK